MRPPRRVEPIFPPNPGSSTEVCYASPVAMGPHPEGDDGRTRRTKSSSHDEIKISLDGFVDEDFRAGGPCLCPLPIDFPALGKSHPAFDRIMDAYRITRYQVRDILRARDIDYHNVGYFLNHHRDSTGFVYSIPTVNILATRHSLQEPWLETSREIYAFLASRRFPDIAVDIYDPAASENHQFSLILADYDEGSWEMAAMGVAKFLRDSEVVDCEFGRFGPGLTAEENPPTVVVMVCEQSDRDWRMLREKVVSVLNECGLFHVGVSIIKRCPKEGADVCGFCGKRSRASIEGLMDVANLKLD